MSQSTCFFSQVALAWLSSQGFNTDTMTNLQWQIAIDGCYPGGLVGLHRDIFGRVHKRHLAALGIS